MAGWIKATTGDKTVLRKGIIGDEETDLKAWETVHDEYIKLFGLSKLYLKMLETFKQRAILELEYVITRDRMKLTYLDMETAKIESMMNNRGSGMTIEQTLIHLSKWLGQWINPKNITAREYFDLVGEFEKFNKASNGKAN